ncbi:hypothetical protein TEA_001560 [Camellia sinensis var. sinensis]|uniref:Uncharacterized protein n=1 Tax=Camellia sinensis var. sinensis TaxID=542762 RepID=A0A4S4DKJ2_CAMSN|nr:hypothetical protein TEA_001560 [Camellia sinensis var. sinensis]
MIRFRRVLAVIGGGSSSRSKHTVLMSFGDGSQGALGVPFSPIGMGGDAYEPTAVPVLPPDAVRGLLMFYELLPRVARGLESWNEPKRVEGLDQVKVQAAFASGAISAAIGDDGSLVEALAGEEIVKVSLGWGHALAQTKDGKLFGWGYSADARLGQMRKPLESSHLDSSSDIPKATELSSSVLEAAEKLV